FIASRTDPLLPLARLRARSALSELRAANFRFTADETTAFLTEVMGLSLSAEQVTALETRTEGWIAGLHLAALSLQGREDVASFIAPLRAAIATWWITWSKKSSRGNQKKSWTFYYRLACWIGSVGRSA